MLKSRVCWMPGGMLVLVCACVLRSRLLRVTRPSAIVQEKAPHWFRRAWACSFLPQQERCHLCSFEEGLTLTFTAASLQGATGEPSSH